MEVVKVGYAKAHFSALLSRVESGEDMVIARRGKAVARWVPEVSDMRPAYVAFEQAWAMGGADLPDDLSADGFLLPPDDIQVD